MSTEYMKPADIERQSMEIIERELGETPHLSPLERVVAKRVIHTTADFDYAKNLRFSAHVCETALDILKPGTVLVTDTQMALSGISKPAVRALGIELYCFMADADVADAARERGCTRAVTAMEKASRLFGNRPLIFAIGNAPTALLRIAELTEEGLVRPALVVGAPVGFVNIIQSKERLMAMNLPYIVAAGRKGGSTVAAAICNALLYQVYDRQTDSKK